MAEMDDNEYVCKKLGICWHDWIYVSAINLCADESDYQCRKCGALQSETPPIDFAADPAQLLMEMVKRDDWDLFLPEIGHCKRWKERDTVYAHDLVRIDYITTPGLLLKEVAKWFRGKEKV